MPGMAMPHARPEAGVQRDAFSLITLTHPVKFQDGKEVSVLLAWQLRVQKSILR